VLWSLPTKVPESSAPYIPLDGLIPAGGVGTSCKDGNGISENKDELRTVIGKDARLCTKCPPPIKVRQMDYHIRKGKLLSLDLWIEWVQSRNSNVSRDT